MADLRTKIRQKSYLILLFVLVVSLLLLLLAQGTHIRSDWSENKTSSLSTSTLQLLQSLDEPIEIKTYFTAGLPQPYGQLQQFIEDKLVSYRYAGQGNIGFEMINPEDGPNVEASLTALQIPKVQVQVIEDDRAQIRQGYLAIVIEYLDKQEVIPVIQTDAGLEYLLTRKIKKITGKGKQTLAIATGFGATKLNQLKTLQQLLQDDYNFIEVDLESDFVPNNVKTLIVDGVDKQPSIAFRYHLDQFRMNGGGLFVLATNAEPQLQLGFSVLPVDQYANDWLIHDLGISVEPGLVMDQQASRITVNQQQNGFSFRSAVDFPFIANVVNINDKHLISRGLTSVSIPFSSPLLWVDPNEYKEVLLASSQWSAVQGGPPFDINPLVSIRNRFSGLHLQSSSLLLLQQGNMHSSFDSAPDNMKFENNHSHQTNTENGRLLVSGSSSLLDDEFIEGSSSLLILNILDWLSHDEALIELRSRGVTQHPLEPIDKGERTFFKVLWVFALPILLMLMGALRWLALHKRRSQTL